MGVRVSDERPYEIKPVGGPPVWIYDFGLRHDAGAEFQADDVREMFQDAFARVWRGDAENDGFNRLVLAARLTAREIAIAARDRQVPAPGGDARSARPTWRTRSAAPGRRAAAGRALPACAWIRHGPRPRTRRRGALERELETAIDAVESLDEDRILRGFLRVIRAILRTNYFQTDAGGQPKPYLSLKLDPELVPELPEPRPMFEIFVYSPRVEGVHLRGGKVARGGIRWSDRREDFRTEVLGLMKAQMVKNAVIVPVGAKGGFVVKRPPAGGDRAALLAEVVECYRTFMRGLLDVTDNDRRRQDRAAARRRPPRRGRPVPRRRGRQGHRHLLRHRQRDLRRVRLLARRRVRLGRLGRLRPQEDGRSPPGAPGSRSSGTSASSGIDIETQPTSPSSASATCPATCSATACCSRRHIRLVGAFDHRHVFLDPIPDAAASFAERERLFELPGSSWADYDPALISRGRRRLPAHREVDPALARGARGARRRGRVADAERADPRAAPGARSTCSGTAASAPT